MLGAQLTQGFTMSEVDHAAQVVCVDPGGQQHATSTSPWWDGEEEKKNKSKKINTFQRSRLKKKLSGRTEGNKTSDVYLFSLGPLPDCPLPAYCTPINLCTGGQSEKWKASMLCKYCSARATTLLCY